MYGRNYDDFAYRGIQFRWVLSPNRFIYRVYREQELIGTIPVSQVRTRMLPEAIKALYPICDGWLKDSSPHLASEIALEMSPFSHSGEITTEAMAKNRDDDEIVARRVEGVRDRFQRAAAQEIETLVLHPEKYATIGLRELVMSPDVEKPKKKRSTKKGKA